MEEEIKEIVENIANIKEINMSEEFEIEDVWCSGCALNTTGYEWL